MIIVNIIGGLGNQMFQYAFAYTLSKQNKIKLKLDISDFDTYALRQYSLDRYCITDEIASIEEINQLKYKKKNILAKFCRKHTKQYKQDNIYFEGYWQSEKYFQDYKDDLLKIFILKESIHTKSKQYQQQILASQSVSMHIRRGDYISNAHTNSVHGVCELSYYQQATSLLEEKVIKPHFFIFSDDLTWAKENLSFIKHKTFIELERNTPDHEEMFLMSQCQHNIIANSSFSWWGAWLNQNPQKITIAPQHWFNDSARNTTDLIPKSWLRL